MATEFYIDYTQGIGFYLVAGITTKNDTYIEYKHMVNWPTEKLCQWWYDNHKPQLDALSQDHFKTSQHWCRLKSPPDYQTVLNQHSGKPVFVRAHYRAEKGTSQDGPQNNGDCLP